MLAGASVADPSLWSQFGPFAICFVLLGLAILALLTDRAALKKAITEGEARERALYDRIIVQGEHIVPVLAQNAAALEHASRVLERLEMNR